VAAPELKPLVARLTRALRPGESGEQEACAWLLAHGFEILARNFRCRSGEVDVIARDGETVVFVEVKERHGASHGKGHEAVTFGKRRRLVRAARIYASSHGLSEQPLRFDVISIDHGHEGRKVRHDRGAFDVDGR
jgi:putative endonuclease